MGQYFEYFAATDEELAQAFPYRKRIALRRVKRELVNPFTGESMGLGERWEPAEPIPTGPPGLTFPNADEREAVAFLPNMSIKTINPITFAQLGIAAAGQDSDELFEEFLRPEIRVQGDEHDGLYPVPNRMLSALAHCRDIQSLVAKWKDCEEVGFLLNDFDWTTDDLTEMATIFCEFARDAQDSCRNMFVWLNTGPAPTKVKQWWQFWR